MPTTLSRPAADEYLAYYDRYVTLVPDGNLVDILLEQQLETIGMLRRVDDERGLHAYAPGKWTIKEVIGHLCDAERVFAYRALRFARGDAQPVAGFDRRTDRLLGVSREHDLSCLDPVVLRDHDRYGPRT